MNRRDFFVVITSQRTGSTLLVQSLDSATDVFCAGEIFYRGSGIHHPEMQYQHKYLGSKFLGRVVDCVWSRRRVERHLARFYAVAGREASAVGFKVMISQLRTFPAIMPFLLGKRVTCIYLYRRDLFATALSYYKARQSGIYHGNKWRGNGAAQPLEANTLEFRKIFEACRADRDEVLMLHKTFGGHLVAYEDLIDRWDEVIASIGEAIRLPALTVAKALPKLESNVGGVRILNEQELREACCTEAIP